MKKIYLLLLTSVVISCSVEDDSYLEEYNMQSPNGTAQQDDACAGISAGADASKTITQAEADALPSWDEVRKLYLSLLEPGIPRDGKFDPSIWNIINSYNGPGVYSTTYTITVGDCSDSVILSVNVVESLPSDPTCELSAGADASKTITQSEADAIPSWDEVRKLYLSLLEAGVSRNGEFDPSIWDIINSYTGPGSYSTTYTVTEGDCSDSVVLTINVVVDPPQEPTCNLSAGPDASKAITYSEAAAIPSWDEVRKLYLSLLPKGVSRSGTFDPSIWDLINDFNQRGAGTYTTTYTITEGDCSDSVELAIIVVPDSN